jgi:proteasome lid subunit RPN8/RPN11
VRELLAAPSLPPANGHATLGPNTMATLPTPRMPTYHPSDPRTWQKLTRGDVLPHTPPLALPPSLEHAHNHSEAYEQCRKHNMEVVGSVYIIHCHVGPISSGEQRRECNWRWWHTLPWWLHCFMRPMPQTHPEVVWTKYGARFKRGFLTAD